MELSLRILGMVQSTTEFKDHPKVMKGFSATVQLHFPVAESDVEGATAMRLETDGATLKIWAVQRPGAAALVYFGGNAEDVGASIGAFAGQLPDTRCIS